jgi:tetratricopeptide (TPR) repeat protein
MRILLLLALVLSLLATTTLASELDDARLQRASELLASADGYTEAEREFREILEQDPSNRSARLYLARLLSWTERSAESVSEYDRLMSSDPADRGVRLERAEVLSWDGRYARAEREFKSILEADPENARALRGLARVYLWSGALLRADGMYARALAQENDPEAQREWTELRGTFRPQAELHSAGFSDSARYDIDEHRMRLDWPVGLRTRLGGHLGVVRVSHPQDYVPLSIRSPNDRDRATELALFIGRSFTDHWRAELEAGLRDWKYATDRVFAHLELEFSPNSGIAFGFRVERTDQLDISDSFEALQEGLRQTGIALSVWKSLGVQVEGYGSVELNEITDGNQRRAVNGSLSYRPWPEQEFWLHLYSNYMGYQDAALEYYDPKSEIASALGFKHHLPLHPTLKLEYGVGLGMGRTRTRVDADSGYLLNADSRLSWKWKLWSGALGAELSRSQRSSHYRQTRLHLEIERVF